MLFPRSPAPCLVAAVWRALTLQLAAGVLGGDAAGVHVVGVAAAGDIDGVEVAPEHGTFQWLRHRALNSKARRFPGCPRR